MPTITITIELPSADIAWALAEYAKRLYLSDVREKSKNEQEAQEIKEGMDFLQKALNKAGFDPR